MLFTGSLLLDVLGRSDNQIELRNQYGRCCRMISREEALTLDLSLFVGIGNHRRIRFLRPHETRTILNAGSQTTQRLTDGFGVTIAPPQIREHRPAQGARK
jgi:hypothetical protein